MSDAKDGRRETRDPKAANRRNTAGSGVPCPYSMAKRWRGQGVCLPDPTASFEEEMEHYHRDLALMSGRQLYRESCWITHCLAQPLTPAQEAWLFERLEHYWAERRRRNASRKRR